MCITYPRMRWMKCAAGPKRTLGVIPCSTAAEERSLTRGMRVVQVCASECSSPHVCPASSQAVRRCEASWGKANTNDHHPHCRREMDAVTNSRSVDPLCITHAKADILGA